MAYNAVSGTLTAAQNYLPASGSIIANVVSGNLSTSDGAAVINVPRVSNATNNAILTNVSGDANTLTCESNLIFDGTVLTVTGQVTASIGVSASYFEGDGSRLTGISASSAGGGIFNETAVDNAYTTSSIQVGSSGTSPTTLSVMGSTLLSGSVSYKRVTIDDNYSVSTTDYFVGVDTVGADSPVTVTMPIAANMHTGQAVIIKDEGGSAHTNNITVSAQGGNLIDGQNSIVLESPFAAIQFYCDGISKYFIY
jgi:hypothetical protein